MTRILTEVSPVRDVEIEACSTCDRLISVNTRCACCERPVCRSCARVNAGVVWCEECHDNAWDMLPDERLRR